MAHIPLFVAGVRISTWAMLILFANLALYRRASKPLLAGAAWMVGFELAWQGTNVALGVHGPWWATYRSAALFAVGVPFVVATWRRGVRPNSWLMAAVAVVWAVWVGTGFHSNLHTLSGLDVRAEVLNETAKTLWAFACFWPLLRLGQWRRYLSAAWEAV